MRILAITSWWPEPADNGIKLRISRLLRALASADELHLLGMAQSPLDEAQRRAPLRYCDSAAAAPAVAHAPTHAARVASLWRAQPASVRATWSEPFAELVRERAATLKPDVVVAFELSSAPYALLVPDVPRVLDDLEMATIYDGFAAATGRRRLRAWLTWAKHRAYVRQVLRGFAAVSAVSAREQRLVRRLAAATLPVALVPNGADLPERQAFITPEPDTLIYPGALSYAANLDAMRYFVAAILPQLRAARPAVRLRITGRASADERIALAAPPEVELTGFVPDVRPLVARSWAEVVPLRQGSGTRLKILEALALGTPVVSTSKGVEGLELEHGQHLLVADTPASFAAATLLLLGQPALRARLASAGQAAVAARYDWRVIGAQLVDLVRSVATPRSATYVPQPG